MLAAFILFLRSIYVQVLVYWRVFTRSRGTRVEVYLDKNKSISVQLTSTLLDFLYVGNDSSLAL